jgi:hypothetical protein
MIGKYECVKRAPSYSIVQANQSSSVIFMYRTKKIHVKKKNIDLRFLGKNRHGEKSGIFLMKDEIEKYSHLTTTASYE